MGYPGETERQFEELAGFVEEVRFDRISVFRYSPEEGSAAAKLPGRVPDLVAEYRRDALVFDVDAFQEDGLLGGGGTFKPLSGSTRVNELFFEGRMPIAEDQAFAESLSFDTAYRYSDYGDVTTDTYKFGFEWAPVSDVRLRASYQRAVRAANVVDRWLGISGRAILERIMGLLLAAIAVQFIVTGVREALPEIFPADQEAAVHATQGHG